MQKESDLRNEIISLRGKATQEGNIIINQDFTSSEFIGEMRHSLFLMIYGSLTLRSCIISQ